MPQTTIPSIRLHDDIEIPQLGFTASGALPGETQELVEIALGVGYKHVDLVAAHDDEVAIGRALAAAGLPREEYFVALGLRASELDRDSTLTAFEASLERLRLDHVDLFLLDRSTLTDGRLFDAWRAFEEIRREEAARAIGVSNFHIEDLVLLEPEAETPPTINQVELHPLLQQTDLRAWHASHGIVTAARNPLPPDTVLEGTAIAEIAAAYGKTPAQAVLCWHAQLGSVVIAKAATPELIREHIDSFDFELSGQEMAAIERLDRDSRANPAAAKPSRS